MPLEGNYGFICWDSDIQLVENNDASSVSCPLQSFVLCFVRCSFSVVAGGKENSATGSHSFVGGGSHNNAYGEYSVIGGGNENSISTESVHATVAGGNGNTAGASCVFTNDEFVCMFNALHNNITFVFVAQANEFAILQ